VRQYAEAASGKAHCVAVAGDSALSEYQSLPESTASRNGGEPEPYGIPESLSAHCPSDGTAFIKGRRITVLIYRYYTTTDARFMPRVE